MYKTSSCLYENNLNIDWCRVVCVAYYVVGLIGFSKQTIYNMTTDFGNHIIYNMTMISDTVYMYNITTTGA